MKKNKTSQNNTKTVVLKSKNLNIKVITFFSIIGVILLFLISISIFVPKKWIISGGSTSVDPIMEKLSPYYKNNYDVDFIYNSMGSAAAPVGITNGYYDMGFESQRIDNSPSNSCTFTIAQDYFIIVFNLPSGIKGAGTDSDHNFVVLPSNSPLFLGEIMKNIYQGETFGKFEQDVESISGKSAITFSNPDLKNDDIVTFTRESGSGTRDYMEKNIIGESGSTSKASVEASNGGMMNAIQSTPGSVGYVSFSYINQIMNNKNLNLAQIDKELPYEKDSISGKYIFNDAYSLVRPFAGMVRLNSPNLLKCLNFINRILYTTQSDDSYNEEEQLKDNPISELIYNLGFKPSCYNDKSYNSGDNNNDDIQEWMDKNHIDTTKNPF